MLTSLRRRFDLQGFLLVTFLLFLDAPFAKAQDTDAEAVRHFQAAQRAQNAGSLDLAAQEYRRVIQLRPDVAEAYASLGMVYNAQGKFTESAQALGKAERLKPGLPGVALYLGIDLLKENQASQALPYLKKAVHQEPSNKLALTSLSSALWDAGQTTESLEQLRNTILLFPSDDALLLDLGDSYRKAADQRINFVLGRANGTPLMHQVYGDIYLDERSWQKAEAHYYRALEMDPHWRGAHFGLGEIAFRQGKLEDAEQQYSQELQVDPVSAPAKARLAEVAILKGNSQEAFTLLGAAISISPAAVSNTLGLPQSYPAVVEDLSSDAKARYGKCISFLASAPAGSARSLGLALANARLGNTDAFATAWKAYQEALPISTPSDAYRRGVLNFDRQDFHAAESALQSWLLSHPEDLEADYLLARTYRNLSLMVLAQLLAVAPDSYPAHLLLAQTDENAGKDDKAIAEYRTVAQLAPHLTGIHYAIGHIFFEDQKNNDAIPEFEAELQLDRDHVNANAELGAILVDQRRESEAIPYLEKAIQLEPDLWITRRQLGQAYYLQKNYPKAKRMLEEAVQHDVDGTAHYQLGLVYRALGEENAANEQFQIARKMKVEALTHVETQFSREQALPR